MFDIGEIYKINNQDFVIAELREKSILCFKCNIEDDDCMVSHKSTEILYTEISNQEALLKGKINRNKLEELKRKLIFERVEEFYELFHTKKEFDPENDLLPYSGKIYDSKEMVALTDATLDFWLTSGRFSKQFEKGLANYLGVKYALLTNSGSSANLLAISCLTSQKLGRRRLIPGDEVITVAAGFPTTVAPIIQNSLVPVFVDVELGTYNILVDEIEKAISPKTKAIMIAHTMGNPFNLDKIMDIAKEYDFWVVEDNCDALGSRYNGKLTGTFGHIGTSSFYPPHHITMGEGGAVYTNDPLLKTIIESFRDWGRDCWCPSGCDNTCHKRFGWQLGDLPYGYDHKYTYSHLGYNLKVTDMQAAIGLEQLKKLPAFIEKRIYNFNLLKEKLSVVEDYFIFPEATTKSMPSWFGFILTIRDGIKIRRNEIVNFLEENRIHTRMLFAGNLIKQPSFKDVNYRVESSLRNTDKIMNDSFLVGVYPGLDDKQIQYISDKIIEFVKQTT